MARKLAVGVNWQGKPDFKAMIEQAKIADEAGIHSIWVAEAWGRDAFTLLTLLAEHTNKIQLATSIVNIYSRTPAALAQHFGTLDELQQRPHDHRPWHQRSAGDRAFSRRPVQSAADAPARSTSTSST